MEEESAVESGACAQKWGDHTLVQLQLGLLSRIKSNRSSWLLYVTRMQPLRTLSTMGSSLSLSPTVVQFALNNSRIQEHSGAAPQSAWP